MTIDETRRRNLELLIVELGTVTAIALNSDTSRTYLSQIRNCHLYGGDKTRVMGNDIARRIEKGCGKPDGWMDRAHEGEDELAAIYSKLDGSQREMLMEHAKLLSKRKKGRDNG